MGFIVPGTILKLDVESSSRRHKRGLKRVFVPQKSFKEFNTRYKRQNVTQLIQHIEQTDSRTRLATTHKAHTLTDLPTEILLGIFVESENLDSLAATCKLFSHLVDHSYNHLAQEIVQRKYLKVVRTKPREFAFIKRRVSNDMDHDHDANALRTEIERLKYQLTISPTVYTSAHQIRILDERVFANKYLTCSIFRSLSPDLVLPTTTTAAIPTKIEKLRNDGEKNLKTKIIELHKDTPIKFPYLDGDNFTAIDYIHGRYQDKLLVIRELILRDTSFVSPIYQILNLVIHLNRAYRRAGQGEPIIGTRLYERLIETNRPAKDGDSDTPRISDPNVIISCLKFNEQQLLKLVMAESDLEKLASDLQLWSFIMESKSYAYFHQLEKLGLKPTPVVMKNFNYAHYPEDLEQLVFVRRAGEKRLARVHFGHDAACGPHVDGRGVASRAEQHVRRTVPQSDHLVGERVDRNTIRSSKSKIPELELAFAADEQILRLEVSVQHSVVVTEHDSSEQLEHERLDHMGLQSTALVVPVRVHVSFQVLVQILKHKRQLVLCMYDVVQRDDVLVSELLHNGDFSNGCRRRSFLAVEVDFLQRDKRAQSAVPAFENSGVRAFAEFFQLLKLRGRGGHAPSPRRNTEETLKPREIPNIRDKPSVLGPQWCGIFETDVEFESVHFIQAMTNLLRNPNINSTVILRADVLKEYTYTYPDGSDEPFLEKYIAEDTQDISSGDPSEPVLTRNIDDTEIKQVPLPDKYRPRIEMVRRMIPRNPSKDYVINQTCLMMEDGHDDVLIIYTPHIKNPAEIPFYLPPVRSIALLYSKSKLSIHYLPFGTVQELKQMSPIERPVRIAYRLMSTAQRHSDGVRNGYEKRVNHDLVVSKVAFQDRYILLKQKYARTLVEDWRENTDPRKHVFEDIAIAAFLIEFWNKIYPDKELFEFRDLGCGNGLLVYLLSMEGYNGIGIDARARKSWEMYPPEVQKKLKEQVIIPSVLLRPHPAVRTHFFSDNGRVFKVPAPKDALPDVKLADKQQLVELFTAADILASPQVNAAEFPKNTFIIGNHSDELTTWIPLLGYPFMVIPCCSHNLNGDKVRYAAKKLPASPNSPTSYTSDSRYATLVDHVEYIATMFGWHVEREMLRIPSTRNAALIGYTPNNFLPKSIYEIIAMEGGADRWVENTMALMKRPPRNH
ncbi:hypothetical protein OGAPHI_000732 [Ogataea philodendri]|uniref:tRNA (uracil-O(2)-)-methyltransferase n=1 Tax=Ogataea philodendri TaxID=1378263 RepID=A0A9P8PFL6_9ASCO|nr:uncharacterized protein OGAPHI_000732 [Ogataea philodendri]KAH3671021.1 hypothetical protein OGAPHI_000732 [Ogataea philodendri]